MDITDAMYFEGEQELAGFAFVQNFNLMDPEAIFTRQFTAEEVEANFPHQWMMRKLKDFGGGTPFQSSIMAHKNGTNITYAVPNSPVWGQVVNLLQKAQDL